MCKGEGLRTAIIILNLSILNWKTAFECEIWLIAKKWKYWSPSQGSNNESCVLRAVSFYSSHHPQVLLAQFSLYLPKCGLKTHLFIHSFNNSLFHSFFYSFIRFYFNFILARPGLALQCRKICYFFIKIDIIYNLINNNAASFINTFHTFSGI